MTEPFSETQVIHRKDQIKSLTELITGRVYQEFSVDSKGRIKPEPFFLAVRGVYNGQVFAAEEFDLRMGMIWERYYPCRAYGITPGKNGLYNTNSFIAPVKTG